MKTHAYIAGTGTITPVGGDSRTNHLSIKAGISAYRSVDYFTRQRERMHMALIPEDALPPLIDELDVRGKLPFRYRRILRMCQAAAEQAMAEYQGDPVPLFLAMPANDYALQENVPARFLHLLQQQTGLPIDVGASRMIATGRTGVIDALDLALRYLTDLDAEYVLIGGADSYQNSDLLAALDRHNRVLAPGVMDGFAPGEAAGLLLLTGNPQNALQSKSCLPCLTAPGFGEEPGHLFSDETYTGDGLAHAFVNALAGDEVYGAITTIYSSMNGERYWAKEYATAVLRNRKHIAEDYQIEHPADCYGDLGAATGAVLIDLALQAALADSRPPHCLVYCSADQRYRAACCLLALPHQNPQTRVA